MFSLYPELGHCSSQSACRKRAPKTGRPDIRFANPQSVALVIPGSRFAVVRQHLRGAADAAPKGSSNVTPRSRSGATGRAGRSALRGHPSPDHSRPGVRPRQLPRPARRAQTSVEDGVLLSSLPLMFAFANAAAVGSTMSSALAAAASSASRCKSDCVPSDVTMNFPRLLHLDQRQQAPDDVKATLQAKRLEHASISPCRSRRSGRMAIAGPCSRVWAYRKLVR